METLYCRSESGGTKFDRRSITTRTVLNQFSVLNLPTSIGIKVRATAKQRDQLAKVVASPPPSSATGTALLDFAVSPLRKSRQTHRSRWGEVSKLLECGQRAQQQQQKLVA